MTYLQIGTGVGAMLLATSIVAAQSAPPQFQQQKPQSQQQQSPNPGQPAPAAQQAQNSKSKAVALVNGEPITKPEFQQQVRQEAFGQQPGSVEESALKKQALESLIESRLVEQFVRQSNAVSVSGEEVDAVIANIKTELSKQQLTFDDYLSSRGYSEALFRKRIEGSLGWQQFQRQNLKADVLQEFFAENRQKFPADKNFQESQQLVAQAYSQMLWKDIISTTKPRADIKIVDPGLKAAPAESNRQEIPPKFPK